MAIVYSVLSNKGGVGKTSFIANYAALLHEKYPAAKMLLIDTDGQGNLSLCFSKYVFNKKTGYSNIKDFENTVYDVLTSNCTPKEATITIKENVDIIPSNMDMNFLEMDILTNLDGFPSPLTLLKEKIEELDSEYDFIFIDTPPSLGLVTNNVLAASDQIFMPLGPDIFGAQGLIRMMEAVEEFRKKFNRFLEIKAVIPMMVDLRTSLHGEILAQCRQYCSLKDIYMTYTVIKKSIRYSDTVAVEGIPIAWSKSRANRAVLENYEELLDELEESSISLK